MNYPFVCPKCNNSETISMKMSEYTSQGHMCSECNTEMVREVESLVCSCSIDRTNTFYRKVN